MKKKLAFLLAMIMVVSSVPGVSLVASSTNRISRTMITGNNTLWFEYGMNVGSGTFSRTHTYEQIQHWQDGVSLLIELNHPIGSGARFTVDLDGAAWYFRQGGLREIAYLGGAPYWHFDPHPGRIITPVGAMEFSVTIPTGEFDPDEFLIGGIGEFPATSPIPTAIVTNHADFTANLGRHYLEVPPVPDDSPGHYIFPLICPEYKSERLNLWVNFNMLFWLNHPIWSWSDGLSVGDDLVLTAVVPNEEQDTLIGVSVDWFAWRHSSSYKFGYSQTVDGPGLPFGAIRERAYDWTPENLHYAMPANTFNFIPRVDDAEGQPIGGRFLEFCEITQVASFYNFEDGVPYRLAIVGGNWQTRATIELLEDAAIGDVITIPLVARTTRGDDIRLRVSAGFPQITNTTHIIATNIDRRINASFEAVAITPEQIDIGRLALTEQRPGSIPNTAWRFELVAPQGFQWDARDVTAIVDAPLRWNIDGFPETGQRTLTELGINAYTSTYIDTQTGELLASSFIVHMPPGVIFPSTSGHGGTMFFPGLRLILADDSAFVDGRRLYAGLVSDLDALRHPIYSTVIHIGTIRVEQGNNNNNQGNNQGGTNQGGNNQPENNQPDNQPDDTNNDTNQASGDGRGSWGGGGTATARPPAQPSALPRDQAAPPSEPAAPTAPPELLQPVADDFPFTDVSTSAWYYEAVRSSWENALFSGTAYNQFSPQLPMTRAMFAQVFANLADTNLATRANSEPSFGDITQGAWYFAAIEWATELGVVVGMGGELFAPHDNVTREQMAAMLYRYTEIMQIELSQGDAAQFADQQLISYWAVDSVMAIQGAGLITGRPDGSFDPQTIATRAEVATILARLLAIL